MFGAGQLLPLQIGQRPRHPQDSPHRAGTEVQPTDALAEQGLRAGPIQTADPGERPRVEPAVWDSLPPNLPLARRDDPLAHLGRGLFRPGAPHVGPGQSRQVEGKIEAVAQRTGNALLVALHEPRQASARALVAAEVSAGASPRCLFVLSP